MCTRFKSSNLYNRIKGVNIMGFVCIGAAAISMLYLAGMTQGWW